MNSIALSLVLACLMAGPVAAENRQTKHEVTIEAPSTQQERKPFEKVAPTEFLPDLPLRATVGPTSDYPNLPPRAVTVGPVCDEAPDSIISLLKNQDADSAPGEL